MDTEEAVGLQIGVLWTPKCQFAALRAAIWPLRGLKRSICGPQGRDFGVFNANRSLVAKGDEKAALKAAN